MRSIGILVAAVMLAAGSSRAQTGPAKPPAAEGSATVGEETLALFERVCITALLRGEPPASVAATALAGSPRVPQDRLRANGPVRETAGWRVRGRSASFTVMMLEPGTQCAVYAEGVDPAAFLDAAEQFMRRTDALPGWLRQGQPQQSASPRPFGMLSYRRARYVADRPGGGKTPPVAQMAHLVASAADRSDGRPNTAVISTSLGTPSQPKTMSVASSVGAPVSVASNKVAAGPVPSGS